MKYMKIDRLQVFIAESREEMGRLSGHDVAAMIKLLLSMKEELNVMFAAAPSQNDVLATLVSDPEIDWSRVNAFHMDEYIGLDAAAPQGFGNFLRDRIFGKVPFKSVTYLNGNAADPEAEARRYGEILAAHPLDVCFMGIGENGHIAFNDPPVANFKDTCLVKVVKLDERCRQQQVNDGCFDCICKVPTHALSVTCPGLMSAKTVFCMVPAATKAEAVQRTLTWEISEKCPATILRTHDDAKLYIDMDSGKFVL